ncbi:MAG: hypothetical protein ACPG7F_03325 [Aggregatilineales bacterium]
MTLQNLLVEVDELPVTDKWRLVNHLLRTLEYQQQKPRSNWHEAVRATYGIIADNSIERPPQLPLEDREPLAK